MNKKTYLFLTTFWCMSSIKSVLIELYTMDASHIRTVWIKQTKEEFYRDFVKRTAPNEGQLKYNFLELLEESTNIPGNIVDAFQIARSPFIKDSEIRINIQIRFRPQFMKNIYRVALGQLRCSQNMQFIGMPNIAEAYIPGQIILNVGCVCTHVAQESQPFRFGLTNVEDRLNIFPIDMSNNPICFHPLFKFFFGTTNIEMYIVSSMIQIAEFIKFMAQTSQNYPGITQSEAQPSTQTSQKSWPKLDICEQSLQAFSLTMHNIDSAIDYIPITVLFTSLPTEHSIGQLHCALFIHDSNGRAKCISVVKPGLNIDYDSSDMAYLAKLDCHLIHKYLEFMERYCGALVQIECSPNRGIVPNEVYEWIPDAYKYVQPIGILFNRIQPSSLDIMIRELSRSYPEDQIEKPPIDITQKEIDAFKDYWFKDGKLQEYRIDSPRNTSLKPSSQDMLQKVCGHTLPSVESERYTVNIDFIPHLKASGPYMHLDGQVIIKINGEEIYTHSLLDGIDLHSHPSKNILARSLFGVPHLLLMQFFGKMDLGLKSAVKITTGDFDFVRTTYFEDGTRVTYPYEPKLEFVLNDKQELLDLCKFLEYGSNLVLSRVRADLEIKSMPDATGRNDVLYVYSRNKIEYSKLQVLPRGLEKLGLCGLDFDCADRYVPVTMLFSYHPKTGRMTGLGAAFFAHKPNGKAVMVFSEEGLHLKAFTEPWKRYYPDSEGIYFQDDPQYDQTAIENYCRFLSDYLAAPIQIQYDPRDQLISQDLCIWMLGHATRDPRIPASGVLLNRIKLYKLHAMICFLKATLGRKEVKLHMNHAELTEYFDSGS